MTLANNERLRAFVLSPALKRSLIAAMVLGAGAFFYLGLQTGAVADACAAKIENAVKNKDEGYIKKTVRNPGLRKKLAAAKEVELAFVRPVSSDWSRIGFFLRGEGDPELAVLLLSHEATSCEFLKDYEATRPVLPSASPTTP